MDDSATFATLLKILQNWSLLYKIKDIITRKSKKNYADFSTKPERRANQNTEVEQLTSYVW